MAIEQVPTEQLKDRAKKALAGVPDVWCYECSSFDVDRLTIGPVRVEVEFAALKVLGRYPARDKDQQTEWCRRHRELHGPAIEAAKKALRAAKVKFREFDNGRGIKKLAITG